MFMLLSIFRHISDLIFVRIFFLILSIALFQTCGTSKNLLSGTETFHKNCISRSSERNIFSKIIDTIRFQLFPCDNLYSSNQVPTTFSFPSESLMGTYPSNVSLFSNYDYYINKTTSYHSSYHDLNKSLLKKNSETIYSNIAIIPENLGNFLSLSYYSNYNGNLEIASETVYQKVTDLPVISLNGSYSIQDFYLSSSLDPSSTFSFSFSVDSDISYQLEYLGNCPSDISCDTIKGSGTIVESGISASGSTVKIKVSVSTEKYELKSGFLKNKFYLYVTDSSDRISYISFYLVRDDLEPSISGKPTSNHLNTVQAVNDDFSFTFYSIKPLSSLSYTVTIDGSLPSDPALDSATSFMLGDSISPFSIPNDGDNKKYRYRFYGVDIAGNAVRGFYEILLDKTVPIASNLLLEDLYEGTHKVSNKVFVRDPRQVSGEGSSYGSFDLSWSVPMRFSEEEFLYLKIEIVNSEGVSIGTILSVEDLSSLLNSSSSSLDLRSSTQEGIFINSHLDRATSLGISRTSNDYKFDFNNIRFSSGIIIDTCSAKTSSAFLCNNYDNIIQITTSDRAGNTGSSRFLLHPDSRANGSVAPTQPYRDESFSCLPSSTKICSVNFSWRSLGLSLEPSGVYEYILEISKNIDFESIRFLGKFSDVNASVSFGGSGDISWNENTTDGLFFWRVRYVDNVGNEFLNSSNKNSFYLGRSLFDLFGSTSGELVLGFTKSDISDAGVVQAFSGDSLDSCDISSPTSLNSCINYTSTNMSSFVIVGEDSSFGYKVSYLPDVSGDKKSELLISSNKFQNNSAVHGKIYVIKSEAFDNINFCSNDIRCIFNVSSLSSEYLYSYVPKIAGTNFGESISYIGDYNSDGFPDFAVGAYSAENTFGGADLEFGTVYIFGYNSADSNFSFSVRELSFPALSTIGGSVQFGKTICHMGDLNNDGIGDIFIGAPYARYSVIENGTPYTSGIGYLITSLSDSAKNDSVDVGSYQVINNPLEADGSMFGASCSRGYNLSDLPNSYISKSFLVGSPGSNFGKSYLFGHILGSPISAPISLGSFSAGGANGLFGKFMNILNIGGASSLLFLAPDVNQSSGAIYKNSKSSLTFGNNSLTGLSLNLFEGYNTAPSSDPPEITVGTGAYSVFSDLNGNDVFAVVNKENTKVYIYLGESISSLVRIPVSINVENIELVSIANIP